MRTRGEKEYIVNRPFVHEVDGVLVYHTRKTHIEKVNDQIEIRESLLLFDKEGNELYFSCKKEEAETYVKNLTEAGYNVTFGLPSPYVVDEDRSLKFNEEKDQIGIYVSTPNLVKERVKKLYLEYKEM